MTHKFRVLITVKTYPIPSKKYDELVCTAGVLEDGTFIRLYPIRFRDLPFSQQYRKYQWIDVAADKHVGRDSRKESYRPHEDSVRTVGEAIKAENYWTERSKFVLKKPPRSMEELWALQKQDRTSLGLSRPKVVQDLVIAKTDAEWPEKFLEALKQERLWDDRTATKQPPRKVPWKFSYRFSCSDPNCRGHKMMIEDWEVGALYWNCVDGGDSPEVAAEKVRQKFMDQICGKDRDTHFFVGTVLEHGTWVVIGTYWPRREAAGTLFDTGLA